MRTFMLFSWGCYFHLCWFENLLHGTLLGKRCLISLELFVCLLVCFNSVSIATVAWWLTEKTVCQAERKCKDRSGFSDSMVATIWKPALKLLSCRTWLSSVTKSFSLYDFFFQENTAMGNSVSLFQEANLGCIPPPVRMSDAASDNTNQFVYVRRVLLIKANQSANETICYHDNNWENTERNRNWNLLRLSGHVCCLV